jgi:cardiolipin synthase
VIDDAWAMIGSTNIDNRSMRLNFELNIMLYSRELATDLAAVIGGYFEDSTEIRLHEFRGRLLKERLLEAAFRPFAPML